MDTHQQNFKLQRYIAFIGLLLLVIKLLAWYLTSSITILTDASESVINVVAGFIGLYSLYLSARPKDSNHPYGHGKIEFVSAAIEGTLIAIAGIAIIYEAINNLTHPHTIAKLDYGITLVAITAVINYVVGFIAVKQGEKNGSIVLVGTGKHLQSDTYSTIGIVIGLVFIEITQLLWLDSVIALGFAGMIIFTGYRIIRKSLAGIMDEADNDLLGKMVVLLNISRATNWVDLHNLRIIKYGGVLHLDCHLTVPWYLNVHEAHREVDALSNLIRENFGERVELFVHTDGCLDFSCKICSKVDCAYRKSPIVTKLDWTVENIASDCKHRISDTYFI